MLLSLLCLALLIVVAMDPAERKRQEAASLLALRTLLRSTAEYPSDSDGSEAHTAPAQPPLPRPAVAAAAWTLHCPPPPTSVDLTVRCSFPSCAICPALSCLACVQVVVVQVLLQNHALYNQTVSSILAFAAEAIKYVTVLLLCNLFR